MAIFSSFILGVVKVRRIKKNTKIIIENEDSSKFEALKGGIPLSKGETVSIKEGSKVSNYIVTDKKVECSFEGEDQIVEITYTFKRK